MFSLPTNNFFLLFCFLIILQLVTIDIVYNNDNRLVLVITFFSRIQMNFLESLTDEKKKNTFASFGT